MRPAATTADIMGRTFQTLSWVCVGSAGEEYDTPAAADDEVGVGALEVILIPIEVELWQPVDPHQQSEPQE